jgi:hypothetical protein
MILNLITLKLTERNLLKNRILSVTALFTIAILILWFLCPAIAGFFPAPDGHNQSDGEISETSTPSAEPTPLPTPETPESKPLYTYYNIKESKENIDLSIHVLELDPSNPELMVRPVSSHNNYLFGYAFLSEMSDSWQANAAVNAGFSHPNGLLGGLYIVDGELYTPATGRYPALFLKNGKAFIRNTETKISVEGDGIVLDNVYYNKYSEENGIYVFTPPYGAKNRIEKKHLNAYVSDGEVRGVIQRSVPYEIPKDGFLISAIGEEARTRLEKVVKTGMKLELKYEVIIEGEAVDGLDWGYECGSWILRDYEIVAPSSDTWVGTLGNRVPRTAVGIREDGTMVFVVVDGRQKGLSDGMTIKELANKLLELGVKDAANLDGGASSEMIIEGNIVNSPSAGRERMVACGFIIKRCQRDGSVDN